MPIITYEDIIPTLVENTTMRYLVADGVRRTYNIKANEGYVLHVNTLDTIIYDDETDEPTGEVILGYAEGIKSCGINYDWDENPREFYAVLRSSVPENRIFGGGGNDHEVM